MASEIQGVQPGEYLTLDVDHPLSSFVRISSDLAARWLRYNTHNRPMYDSNVLKFQQDMEAGRWRMDGSPIRFSRPPVTLLDGQNRLMALANTVPSMELVFNVVRGLDHSTQRTMDTGLKVRTPGQQLGLAGVHNAPQIAAVVRLLIAWQEGLLFDPNRARAISVPQIQEWVDDNMGKVELFNHNLARPTSSLRATPSVAGTLGMRLLMMDGPAITAFMTLLHKRANLSGDSPILALDTRLGNLRDNRVRLPQREELGYFILAWNMWIKGESATKIQAPKGGFLSHNFPRLRTDRGVKFDHEEMMRGLEIAGGYTTC